MTKRCDLRDRGQIAPAFRNPRCRNALSPQPAARSLNFDTYVPGLVTWLGSKLSAGASKLYSEQHGLGVIDWRVLACIAAEDGCSAARICQIVGLDKGALSRSFALLAARGLVDMDGRAQPAPDGGRQGRA